MADKPRAPLFGIGLFTGILIGSFMTLLLSTDSSEEAIDPPRAAKAPDHTGDGHGGAAPSDAGGGHGGGRDPNESMAKVHFMKKFVAALTKLPANGHPAADWQVLLKDPQKPISCSDCHKDSTLDFEKMAQADPGNTELVQRLRRAPRFMVPLMEKWVERLNKWHGDKLVAPVTCTSCHAVDPKKKWSVYPPLMNAFVSALTNKPTNKNPASSWKPLLKDPQDKSKHCAACHGETGAKMAEHLDSILTSYADKPTLDEYSGNKGFMANLMEDWMSEANKKLKGVLAKPLACIDCHEKDPRRE